MTSSDSFDYAEVVFDREAQLWRISHRGELVMVPDTDRLAGWLDYSAADRVKRRLDPQPVPLFGGWR